MKPGDIPTDIQNAYGTALTKATVAAAGAFYLKEIRRAVGHESQRITVRVLDQNGFPMPGVPVAFAFDTAQRYALSPDFQWSPPQPRNAQVLYTNGGGECDQIQGSTINRGETGGVTVYALHPQFSSDVVSGCGMLPDHTGLHLTFQLWNSDYASIYDELDMLEQRIAELEKKVK